MTDNQSDNINGARFSAQAAGNSNRTGRVGESIPQLITKKWLRARFDIASTNKNRLYRLVLTDDVLESIGLSTASVRKHGFKTFTAHHSRLLSQILFG